MADYKIKREDILDSSKIIQIKMRDLRLELVKMLESSDRDFVRLARKTDEYIKAFKTNDYLLGYAKIDEIDEDVSHVSIDEAVSRISRKPEKYNNSG